MQNITSLHFSDSTLVEIDGAVDVLRRAFAPLTPLTTAQRRALVKMGDKSEVFGRHSVALLAANPDIVPRSLDVQGALADISALDALRPRLMALRELVERGNDTEMALGADIMSVALEGYALLKVSGKTAGLKGARKELSARFAKTRRTPEPVTAD
jgi:hypothetical protein